MAYVAIQWIEDPPKWDVLPCKQILPAEFHVGDIVDCRYGNETAPARILKTSNKKQEMDNYIDTIAIQQTIPETSTSDEVGQRRMRKKTCRYISENEDNDEDYNEKSSTNTSYKKLKQRKTSRDYDEIIKQYVNVKDSSNEIYDYSHDADIQQQLQDLKKTVATLKAENERLKNKIIEMESLDMDSIRRLPKAARRLEKMISLLSSDKKETTSTNNNHLETSQCSLAENNLFDAENEKMISIGSTSISEMKYSAVNFGRGPAQAVKDLCVAVFGREVLATHSLTGKNSNALKGAGQAKPSLNDKHIKDIIAHIQQKTKAPESIIRKAISQKCNDENKLWRRRQAFIQRADDNNTNN